MAWAIFKWSGVGLAVHDLLGWVATHTWLAMPGEIIIQVILMRHGDRKQAGAYLVPTHLIMLTKMLHFRHILLKHLT